MQEALLAAALQWPRDGVPAQPARLALHRRAAAADRRAAQRERAAPSRERSGAGARAAAAATAADEDDTLDAPVHVLPRSLSPPSQVALDAARRRRPDHRGDRERVPGPGAHDGAAHQPGEATISAAGARVRLPPDAERGACRVVLHVLYLIFNEGYTATLGRRTCPASS